MSDKEFDRKIKVLFDQGRFEEIEALLQNDKQDFWAKEYLEMTIDERIVYWSNSIHLQMRTSGASGYDEMSIFSNESFRLWEAKEPKILELLPKVLEMLRINPLKVYPLLGIDT